MGELADYLVEHDPNFRKARLPALYSDFRPQQTLNPDGYRANISAWRHALSLLASSGVLPAKSSSTPFILDLDTSLIRSLQNRQFGQPLALGTVVRETVAERGFVPVQDFLKSQRSIYYHGWGELPWNMVGWTLRTLGVTGPGTGEDKLPKGRFVIMENVEKAGKEVQARLEGRTSKFERIFTKEQFRREFATDLVGEQQRLGEEDVDVLLRFLSRDRGLVEYDGKIVKVKAAGEQGGVTEEDSTIASIKELTARLQHQIQLLNKRTEELEQAAKSAVARKQRVPALAALKSKKQAEASLSARYNTLSQLEAVAAKIEQASDQVQILKVMESSTSVLKGLNEQIGGVERVEGVMDGLRDQMADVDEVAEMIGEGGRVVDDEEIGEELEALEREEREKEEAEERRKLAELPDVPREVTPTTETGIAQLSIDEREREAVRAE
ncbi:hypothetical protein NLU13_5003 [Sarocladium strictum]|uniref:Uncharacterized protein n=1 Tax=Sarocladium strictum TaxID=5046 RepID=A0AA39L9C9_SARSR|nr:hypothetical protein NLU13_5003 [Sarocladium strictum]